MIGMKFDTCNFDYADLRGVDLSGLDLSNSSFFETDMSMANLDKTVFVNSRLTNVKWEAAKFNMTDLRGAEILGISLKQNLRGVILTPQQVVQMAEAIGIHVVEAL
jgi:uncharacterized protein YjbI with pentapeptide repeats